MPMRKRTIRRLTPLARDLARLQVDAASVQRRLTRLIARVGDLELEAQTLRAENEHFWRLQSPVDPEMP